MNILPVSKGEKKYTCWQSKTCSTHVNIYYIFPFPEKYTAVDRQLLRAETHSNNYSYTEVKATAISTYYSLEREYKHWSMPYFLCPNG